MDKLRTNESAPRAERRSGGDRRHVDGGPPGKHDRRRGLESRKPEVVELDMSDSDWIALTQIPVTPAR
jgi:hypothetical protein